MSAAVWFDSRCHLPFLKGGAEPALERAREAGVAGMVTVGTDLASSNDAVELARDHPDVRATVGLHPHDASRFDDEWDALRTLARAPEVKEIFSREFLPPRKDRDLVYTAN